MMSQKDPYSQIRYWSLLRISVSVSLVVIVSLSAISATPTVVAQDDSQTYTVQQGGKCIEITPLGDGTQSIDDYYDYRSPLTEPEGLYSSYGTSDIQLNQVSQLFAYHGKNGTSLVFLHDRLGAKEGGFVATADISGLPKNGTWAVKDDHYRDRQDDVFETNRSGGQQAHIKWLSNSNRTDGAAFRGIESSNYDEITVDIKFNSRSDAYPFQKWQGAPEDNEIERWITRSGTGETTSLNMNQSVSISQGACADSNREDGTADSENTASSANDQSKKLFSDNSSDQFTATETETPGSLFSNTSTETPTPTTTETATPTETPTPQPTPQSTTAATATNTTDVAANSSVNAESDSGLGLTTIITIGLGCLGILALGLAGFSRYKS